MSRMNKHVTELFPLRNEIAERGNWECNFFHFMINRKIIYWETRFARVYGNIFPVDFFALLLFGPPQAQPPNHAATSHWHRKWSPSMIQRAAEVLIFAPCHKWNVSAVTPYVSRLYWEDMNVTKAVLLGGFMIFIHLFIYCDNKGEE